VPSLSPRCIGTDDSSVTPAYITTAGSSGSGWFPISFFDGFSLARKCLEIFWFVNDTKNLSGQTLLDVKASIGGGILQRISFTQSDSEFSTLTWEWADGGFQTPHAVHIPISNAILPRVWWHSVLQYEDDQAPSPEGTIGDGRWHIYHGRVGVSANGTISQADHMPYEYSGTDTLGSIGGLFQNSRKLMGFRTYDFTTPEYRIALGTRTEPDGTTVVPSSYWNGGFAELRTWTPWFDPQPIPGDPPTPSELERRRNIFVRANNITDTPSEGSEDVGSNIVNAMRFNEPAGTLASAYDHVGRFVSDFDGTATNVSGQGYDSSPILVPVGGVVVDLRNVFEQSLSSSDEDDLGTVIQRGLEDSFSDAVANEIDPEIIVQQGISGTPSSSVSGEIDPVAIGVRGLLNDVEDSTSISTSLDPILGNAISMLPVDLTLGVGSSNNDVTNLPLRGLLNDVENSLSESLEAAPFLGITVQLSATSAAIDADSGELVPPVLETFGIVSLYTILEIENTISSEIANLGSTLVFSATSADGDSSSNEEIGWHAEVQKLGIIELWYEFQSFLDVGGTNYIDNIAGAANLEVVESPTTFTEPHLIDSSAPHDDLGSMISFSQGDQTLVVADGNAGNPGLSVDPFTIIVSVDRLNQVGLSSAGIVRKPSDLSGDIWNLRLNIIGAVVFERRTDAGGLISITSNAVVDPSRSNLIIATFDTIQGMRLYLDGSLVASSSNTTANEHSLQKIIFDDALATFHAIDDFVFIESQNVTAEIASNVYDNWRYALIRLDSDRVISTVGSLATNEAAATESFASLTIAGIVPFSNFLTPGDASSDETIAALDRVADLRNNFSPSLAQTSDDDLVFRFDSLALTTEDPNNNSVASQISSFDVIGQTNFANLAIPSESASFDSPGQIDLTLGLSNNVNVVAVSKNGETGMSLSLDYVATGVGINAASDNPFPTLSVAGEIAFSNVGNPLLSSSSDVFVVADRTAFLANDNSLLVGATDELALPVARELALPATNDEINSLSTANNPIMDIAGGVALSNTNSPLFVKSSETLATVLRDLGITNAEVPSEGISADDLVVASRGLTLAATDPGIDAASADNRPFLITGKDVILGNAGNPDLAASDELPPVLARDADLYASDSVLYWTISYEGLPASHELIRGLKSDLDPPQLSDGLGDIGIETNVLFSAVSVLFIPGSTEAPLIAAVEKPLAATGPTVNSLATEQAGMVVIPGLSNTGSPLPSFATEDPPSIGRVRSFVGTPSSSASASGSGSGGAGGAGNPVLLRTRKIIPIPDSTASSELEVPIAAGTIQATISEAESVSADLCTLEAYLSKLDIWNVALTKLGIETVSATTDSVPQAVAMAANWDSFKGTFLRDHMWNGANTTVDLVRYQDTVTPGDVDPTGPWSYAYRLDNLTPEWVRSLRLNGKENRPGTKSANGLGLWTEQVVFNDNGDGALCLLTNETSATLDYTFKVHDCDIDKYLPEDMRWAMAITFAVHMASDLGSSNADVNLLEQQAEIARRNARRTDSQSGARTTVIDYTIHDAFY